MSFNKWSFIYTPPKTLSNVLTGSESQSNIETATNNTSFADIKNNSLANQLAKKISDLKDTSNFLQSQILNKLSSTGLEIDNNSDPALSSALNNIYGTNIKYLTAGMYSNLLDTEVALSQIDNSSNNTPIQADKFQLSDVITVTQSSDNLIANSGDTNLSNLLLLRSLKNDVVFYNSINDTLGTLPVVTIEGSVVDLSSNVMQTYSQTINSTEQVYGSIYNILNGVEIIEQDISNVIELFLTIPINDITRLIAVITAMKSSSLVSNLKGLINTVESGMYGIFLAELSQVHLYLDQFMQRAVQPLNNNLGNLGQILSKINGIINGASKIDTELNKIKTKGNTGQDKNDPTISNLPSNNLFTSSSKSSITNLSSGLQSIGYNLNWALSYTSKKFITAQDSMTAAIKKKLNNQNNTVQILATLKSLNSLISLAEAIKKSTTSNTNISQSLSNIINNYNYLNNNSSLNVTNNTVVVATTNNINIPNNIQNVLVDGGATL